MFFLLSRVDMFKVSVSWKNTRPLPQNPCTKFGAQSAQNLADLRIYLLRAATFKTLAPIVALHYLNVQGSYTSFWGMNDSLVSLTRSRFMFPSQLCWAIGSISGAMHEEDEKRFLVTVIKVRRVQRNYFFNHFLIQSSVFFSFNDSHRFTFPHLLAFHSQFSNFVVVRLWISMFVYQELLGLVEQKRGKDNKAIIAANIMYIVGQYPRFLRAHWRFLKTVVNKLFEFMHGKLYIQQ